MDEMSPGARLRYPHPARRERPRPPEEHYPTFELSYPHKGLLRLREWVAGHGGARLTRRVAASIACLEPHHLSAVFRDCTGLTFLQWRRGHRIVCALRAIESGIYRLDEVVHLVGYRDRRSLERAIKSTTGKTPAAFSRGSMTVGGVRRYQSKDRTSGRIAESLHVK